MARRVLLLATLLLVACNSILGNIHHHLVEAAGGADEGPPACRLNSDCQSGEVCIFQSCGPACLGDTDCDVGSRCLKTDSGTACVAASTALCDAGCPGGTICRPSDGFCRNDCSRTPCLPGQSCFDAWCVGTDEHEAQGDLVSDGAGGGSGGDAAGPSEGDCEAVECDAPPAATCTSDQQLKTYDKVGSCEAGVCDYTPHLVDCACQDDACATDPCLSITCNAPPAASCKGDDLTEYAAQGTCSAGSCGYEATQKSCPFGCAKGACNQDPCKNVSCTAAPPPKCQGPRTRRTFSAPGTCSAGECDYSFSDEDCKTNRACDSAAVCSVCKADASCGAGCSACGGSTPRCKDLGATSTCVGCLSDADCGWPKPLCNTTTNACEPPPSCLNLGKICGKNGDQDCCASSLVTGGSFYRGNDSNSPATVADFRLDNYEITVGRFRNFVKSYSQSMIPAGAGKNPHNPGDQGWDGTWNSNLDPDATALETAMQCSATYQTWTHSAGTALAESLPINCVTWFEVEAFCIWDGGRLPTEAEWNYAAAGGSAQRQYPWGSAAPDCSYANYKGASGGNDFCVAPGTGGVNRVGSESPKGDGLFGQADLGGNVLEWVQDWYAPYVSPCDNCASLDGASSFRVLRGGRFDLGASNLTSSYRLDLAPGYQQPKTNIGARCARSP